MVRRATSHRLDFDAAAIYQYPEHLRQWLEGLPKVPGVYTFHGESENLPTYQQIDDYLEGKTINAESAKIIEGWYTKTEHKRRMPVTVFDDYWKK
ncbi:hypothetical protein CRX72_16325 [Pantoea sp. BRM17]|nr:hypothetical protein CRX72_16325 [Pantoea sp. BRM17]